MLTGESVTFRGPGSWGWQFGLTFMLPNFRCIWDGDAPRRG